MKKIQLLQALQSIFILFTTPWSIYAFTPSKTSSQNNSNPNPQTSQRTITSPDDSTTTLNTWATPYETYPYRSTRYRPRYRRWNYADINFERPGTNRDPNLFRRRRWSFDNDFYYDRASYRRPNWYYYDDGDYEYGYDRPTFEYYTTDWGGRGTLYDSPRRSARLGPRRWRRYGGYDGLGGTGGYEQWPWPDEDYYECRFGSAEYGSGYGYGSYGNVYGFGRNPQQLWDSLDFIPVQGDSRRTCSISEYVDRVQVVIQSSGDVCKAEVDVWGGPNREAMKMNVYLEDGYLYPFRAIISTPRQSSNSISIRNIGVLEFPFSAAIEPDRIDDGRFNNRPDIDFGAIERLSRRCPPRPLQGGAVETFPMPPSVQSVQILLETDGRPLRAKVELLQGPNNCKQVVEVQCDDGQEHPLYLIMETPIDSNVIRIENIASMEFPVFASVLPYTESNVYERARMLGPSTTWM